MTMQIAVRIPDEMAEQLDLAVAEGHAKNRTALVTAALERELRRLFAERDAAILREVGSGDGLDALVDWTVAGGLTIEL